MKFSEKLSKLRKENNFSQETLAEKLGMSRQAISKWESGSSYPDMSTMINICKVLNCTLEDLLDDDAIGKDNFEKNNNNKINMNKYLKDLLDFITRSYNMFWSMKFIDKLKCIIEMGFIILILFLVAFGLGFFLDATVFQIFYLLPYTAYSVIHNLSKIIYSLLWLLLGSIITIHLFKIRYLDYYVTVEDESVAKKEIEKEVDQKETKKKEKIIIRDPKHTTYSFFSGLAKIVMFILKLFSLMFLIPLVFVFISLVASVTLSILWFKYGVIFLGILIALLGAMLVDFGFIEILFNFIFNRISNFKKLFIIFILGFIVAGVGTGISLYEFSTFNFVKDNRYENTTLTLDMENSIILQDVIGKDTKIIFDDTKDDISIKIKHLNTYKCFMDGYSDNEYYIYQVLYNYDNSNIIKDVLESIKNKEIRDLDGEYIYTIDSITLSKENYEMILKNYEDYKNKYVYQEFCE